MQGLFTLAQTLNQGRRDANQTAGGLFEMLGNSLSPISDMDMGDPTSIRAAAEGEMRRGNTVKGQELMRQAGQVEQKQEQDRVNNIKRAYGQMKAMGREEEFTDAMMQAGRIDEIAAIKRQEMQDDILAFEFGDKKRAAEFKVASNAYYKAQTPEGKETALQALIDKGFGEEAAELRRRAARVEAEATELELRQTKADWQRDVQRIQAYGVPDTEEGINAVREQIPQEMRGIYDQQVAAVLAKRVQLEEARERLKKDEMLDKDFVEQSGLTWEQYQNLFKVSQGRANESVINSVLSKTRTEASTLPNGVALEQLNGLFDDMSVIEDAFLYFDKEVIDPRLKRQVVMETWDLMQKEGLGARAAMVEAVMTVQIEQELIGLEDEE